MSRRIIVSLVFILGLTLTISCSGGNGNIVTPDPVDRDNVSVEAGGETLCMGLWQVVIDTKTGTGEIVQLRSADKIINVLGFMEPPPLSLMDLDWPNLVIDPSNNIIEVGVILKHPIAGDDTFRGFDVRGVCFGPDVTNADGLTIITSPEYFKGVPFGYQDGLLGAPDSVGHYTGLAGYKYFCDGLSATEDLVDFFTDPGNLDNRGSFGSGNQNQRDYILDWTDVTQAFFVFNYSIYANYDWPVGGTDLDDFDIATANCAEAFACKVTETANSLYYFGGSGGGTLSLSLDIWDWQGNILNVSIESVESGVLPKTTMNTSSGPGSTAYSYLYDFINVSATPTSAGTMDLLITVTDASTFGEHWFLDLLSTGHDLYDDQIYTCWNYTTTVSDESPFGMMDPVMVSSDKNFYHSHFIKDSNGVYHIFASWENQSDYTIWETHWFHSEDQGQTWTAEGDIFGIPSSSHQKAPTRGFAAAVDDNGGVYILMGETKRWPTSYTTDVLQAKIKFLDTSTGNHDNPANWSASDWEEKIGMNNLYGYRYAGGLYASLSVTPDGRILGTMIDYVMTYAPTPCAKYFYADSWTDLPASAAGLSIIGNMPPPFSVSWWAGLSQNPGVYNPITDTFFVSMAGYFNTGSGNHAGAFVFEYDPNASGQPWSEAVSYEEPTVTATTNRLFNNFNGDLAVDSSGNVHWVHQYMIRPTSYNLNTCQFCVLYGKRDATTGTWDLTDNPINNDYILPPAPPNSSTNFNDYSRAGLNIVANSNDDLIMTWKQCNTNPNLLGSINTGTGWTAMPGNTVIPETDHAIYAFGQQGEALQQYVGLTFVSEEDPPVDRRGQLWFFITDAE